MEKITDYRKDHYKKYLQLKDVLPLNTPLTLFIDPSNICNFKCIFCPTGDDNLLKKVNRPKGVMDFKLFCKLIDDIAQFNNKLKVLHLYKDGEPFINKNICEMISYAKQKKVAENVATTTNGSLITKELAMEIIGADLDSIRISVEHPSREGYKKLTQKDIDYHDIVEGVSLLYHEKMNKKSHLNIHIKIIDTMLSEDEKKKFYEDFKNICDTINIDSLMGWSNSSLKDFTLGIHPEVGMDGFTRIQSRKVCPEPFKSMAVNFDGSVSACCVDWSHNLIIGDSTKENLKDIWNGQKLNALRKLHLKKQKDEIMPCHNCQYMLGGSASSNLDQVADELLKKF